MSRALALSIATLFFVVACVSPVDREPADPASAQETTDGPRESNPVFEYLLDRYDRDDDGTITADEYDREGADFARLDRTMDGRLTAEDFERSGRRVRALHPSEGRRLRAVHLVAWYLQDDDDAAHVGRSEVQAALQAYDRNEDGRVGRTEFERIADRRARYGRRPDGRWAGLLEVETTDPFERLIDGTDGNDDGFLTAAELDAFYTSHEAQWTIDPALVSAPPRALTGQVAPDFTLASPDGATTVTLSDFAGERPVALIFGSYT